jgi:hypothetical protein
MGLKGNLCSLITAASTVEVVGKNTLSATTLMLENRRSNVLGFVPRRPLVLFREWAFLFAKNCGIMIK